MSYYSNEGQSEFNIGIPYFVYAYVDNIQLRPKQASEAELKRVIIKDKLPTKKYNSK